MPFVWRVRITYADTDASQRIHHTALLKHFEAAEHEFRRSLGATYPDPTTTGIGYPRVHVECDMEGPVVFDDLVDIGVCVERIGNSSYTIAFAASIGERKVARGRFTIVSMDLATQRACPLPEALRVALEEA